MKINFSLKLSLLIKNNPNLNQEILPHIRKVFHLNKNNKMLHPDSMHKLIKDKHLN